MKELYIKSNFNKYYKDYDDMSLGFISSFIIIMDKIKYLNSENDIIEAEITSRDISLYGKDATKDGKTASFILELYGDNRFVKDGLLETFTVSVCLKILAGKIKLEAEVSIYNHDRVYISMDTITKTYIEDRINKIYEWILYIFNKYDYILKDPIPMCKALDEVRKITSILDGLISDKIVKKSISIIDILIKWFSTGIIRYIKK